MHRIPLPLASIGVATGLLLAVACSQSPSSPSSTSAGPVTTAGASADGSTLKATAPTHVSPANNELLTTRRPTLVTQASSGTYVTRSYSYQFELQSDGGTPLRTATVSTTSWTVPEDLGKETPYRWRVRATLDGTYGPWSSPWRFITAKEMRTTPGQVVTTRPNSAGAIIFDLASREPGRTYLQRSCQETGGTWEWMDLVVDSLRATDTRWGYNGKRGNPNDPSKDVVSYNWGAGPDEGSKQVYIYDTVTGHCGPSPGPLWADVTDITYNSGTTGLWISRGRFPGWTP